MYACITRETFVFTVFQWVFHSILKLELCRHAYRRRDQIISTCRYGKNMPTTALGYPEQRIAMHYNGQKWANFKSRVQGVKWQNQTEQSAFSNLRNGTTKISTSITKSWSEVTSLIGVLGSPFYICENSPFIAALAFYGMNMVQALISHHI